MKWGFKKIVRSEESGMLNDFFLYSGSTGGQRCPGSYVDLKVLKTLPINEHFQV